jgi:hypothetical protein
MLPLPSGKQVISFMRGGQPPQVFVDADQAERPGSRRSEFGDRRQCLREELSSHHLEAPEGRSPHAHAQGPERSTLTVLRSLGVKPAAPTDTAMGMASGIGEVGGVIGTVGSAWVVLQPVCD